MKMKILYILFFLVCIIFFASKTSFAQVKDDNSYIDDIEGIINQPQYLIGLKKVSIFIATLSKKLKENGVTENQLQTEAEIRLRRAGIYDERAEPTLWINLTDIESNDYSVGYNFEFYLREPARLDRNNLLVYSETWRRTNYGTAEKNRIQIDVRETVGKYIDKFIIDWLKANTPTAKQGDNLPDLSKYAVKSPPPLPPLATKKQDDSPFTATYVGGNRAPTVEVFNDSNKTMYFDFGQGKMTAYTILSGGSQKITLTEGNYNYKASAPRVRSDEGQEIFKNGYVYTWRFYIVTVPR